MKIIHRARPDCPLSRRRAEYTVAGRRIGVLLFWLLLSIDSSKVTKNKRINDRNNSSYIRFDNSPKPSSTLQLLPTAKPGSTKDKQKHLKFFLQFLQPENQQWLSTVTMVGEQTLESNNMSDEESDFE